MKKILVLLAALTLSLGSVQAASFSDADTYRMTEWHSGEANRYRASYAYTSLSEVVGA